LFYGCKNTKKIFSKQIILSKKTKSKEIIRRFWTKSKEIILIESTQHPDQQRYDENDDKKRRAKAAQKMMHGDLFLRGLIPYFRVLSSFIHRITNQ